MPRRFKGEPLFTAVQSELFDTDIEEFSAQADERWALFQSPDPRGARASIRAYKTPARRTPCRGLWLFGAPAGYEQSCTVFALARGFHDQSRLVSRGLRLQVITLITSRRWVTGSA